MWCQCFSSYWSEVKTSALEGSLEINFGFSLGFTITFVWKGLNPMPNVLLRGQNKSKFFPRKYFDFVYEREIGWFSFSVVAFK